MKLREIIIENKKAEAPKPRNFVAKNAMKTTSGAGAHKDKKKAEKQGDVKHKSKLYAEDATPGSTSASSIATVINPHVAIGSARGKKSYTGSPGKSGTKAPKPPKSKMQKPTDNALDMKGVSIFGGKTIKR